MALSICTRLGAWLCIQVSRTLGQCCPIRNKIATYEAMEVLGPGQTNVIDSSFVSRVTFRGSLIRFGRWDSGFTKRSK